MNLFTCSSFSHEKSEQVMYASVPPVVTKSAVFSSISVCIAIRSIKRCSVNFHLASGDLRQEPLPEHGTSTTTRSYFFMPVTGSFFNKSTLIPAL